MYLGYTRSLHFEARPDYTYSRMLFHILFRTLGLKYDYMFDWTILKQKGVNEADTSDQNTQVPTTQTQIQMQEHLQRQQLHHHQQQYHLHQQQQHNQLQHQQEVQCLTIEDFQPMQGQPTLEPVEQTRGTKNSD